MVDKVGSVSAPRYVSQTDLPLQSKPQQSAPAPREEIPFVLRANALQWLAVPGIHKNALAIKPIRINAPADVVFSLMKSVNRYGEFSGGVCEAHMKDGLPVATGNEIDLSLHMDLDPLKELIFGSQLESSKETVMLDESSMALGWHRKVPLTCGKESERWQVVVPRDDNTCDYYSGLYIPALMGKIAMKGVGEEILEAFTSIGNGIAVAAERRA